MDTARSVSELSSTTLDSSVIYPSSQDESLEMEMEIDTDEDTEEERLVCFGMVCQLLVARVLPEPISMINDGALADSRPNCPISSNSRS